MQLQSSSAIRQCIAYVCELACVCERRLIASRIDCPASGQAVQAVFVAFISTLPQPTVCFKVLAVNGEDTVSMRAQEVWLMVKASGNEVLLLLDDMTVSDGAVYNTLP